MLKFILPLTFLLFFSCGKKPLFLNFSENNKTKMTPALESRESFFPKTNYAYSLQWVSGPFNVGEGESKFKLRIWDKSSGTLYGPFLKPNEKVCAFIWMKMNDGSEHGSSPLKLKLLATDDGPIFYYTEAYFLMNGRWQLYLKLVDSHVPCLDNPSLKAKSEVIHELNIH